MQLISKELTDFLYSARQKLDIHTYTETSPWINFANSETLQIIKVLKKSMENVQLFSAYITCLSSGVLRGKALE